MALANHPHLADLHGFERHFPETWREEACQYLLEPARKGAGMTRAGMIASLLRQGVRPGQRLVKGGTLDSLPDVCRSKWKRDVLLISDDRWCEFTLGTRYLTYVEAEFALYLLERNECLIQTRALLANMPGSQAWF